MRSRFICHAERAWAQDSFRIYIGKWEHDHSAFRPLQLPNLGDLVPESGSAEHVDPLVTLDRESAQDLFNALWHTGLRPERDQSDGERSAMKEHIADLRMVVQRTLPEVGR